MIALCNVSGCVPKHAVIVEAGLVSALTNLANAGPRSASFDLNCAATLRNLTTQESNLESVTTTRGTVRLIIDLAKVATSSNASETQTHAAVVLYNLTRGHGDRADTSRAAVSKAGGVEALIGLSEAGDSQVGVGVGVRVGVQG